MTMCSLSHPLSLSPLLLSSLQPHLAWLACGSRVQRPHRPQQGGQVWSGGWQIPEKLGGRTPANWVSMTNIDIKYMYMYTCMYYVHVCT